MLYKLQFMSWAPAQATLVLDLIGPQINFWDCAEMNRTCRFQYPRPEDYPYCLKRPCEVFDAYDIASSQSSNIFLATKVAHVVQEKCVRTEKAACTKLWNDVHVADRLVAGIENYNLKMQHAYTSNALRDHFFNTGTQGFLKVKGEQTLRPIRGFSSATAERRYRQQPLGYDNPPCGDNNAHSDHTCFSSGFGDIISLGVLLNAAGLKLDEPAGQSTVRETGVVLKLDIWYTNGDPFDFYVPPVGPTPKYIIEPNVLYMAGERTPAWIGRQSIHDTDNKNRRRTLEYKTGIDVVVQVKGTLGSFDLFHFIVVLAVSMAMLSISKTLVNHILVRIYHKTPGFRHISVLHALHWTEETCSADDLHPVVHSESLEHESKADRILDIQQQHIKHRTVRLVGGVPQS